MADALVTGGTGFVGANVVRELLREGAQVRVLARPRGDRRAIDGLKIDVCEGDLGDAPSLRRAAWSSARVPSTLTRWSSSGWRAHSR